jgi:D-glycero-D-manno-heptose 1,7-bisphosphate phosphatase
MILEAAADHGIDLTRSFMIGDRNFDIECGKNAGVRTILVETGYGKEHLDCGADFIAPTVTEAIRLVLEGAC